MLGQRLRSQVKLGVKGQGQRSEVGLDLRIKGQDQRSRSRSGSKVGVRSGSKVEVNVKAGEHCRLLIGLYKRRELP